MAPLVLFALVQWLGLRESSWTQQATSLVKGLALLAFVALCFAHGPAGHGPAAASAGAPGTGLAVFTLIGVVIAMQSVIVTYDGWYMAIYFTEEDEDPARNLPRSALLGVLATVAIYLLVNLALLRVLSVPELAASSLPVADAAQAIFGGAGGPIVTALALVSLLGIVNAILMSGTRIAYAVARDGGFGSLARVSPSGTPVPALLLTTGASMLLALRFTFEQMIAISAALVVFVYVSGFLSLFVLRRREPDLPRPFRVPGYPWVPLVALVGSLAFLAGNLVSDPRGSAWTVALLALSYPAFRLLAARRGPRR
jgi:APA family basic amino acid/polyamine antiporter